MVKNQDCSLSSFFFNQPSAVIRHLINGSLAINGIFGNNLKSKYYTSFCDGVWPARYKAGIFGHTYITLYTYKYMDRTKRLTLQHIRGQSNYEQDILFTRTLHIRAQGNYDFEMVQAVSTNCFENMESGNIHTHTHTPTHTLKRQKGVVITSTASQQLFKKLGVISG